METLLTEIMRFLWELRGDSGLQAGPQLGFQDSMTSPEHGNCLPPAAASSFCEDVIHQVASEHAEDV
jgi:hypothetical protein